MANMSSFSVLEKLDSMPNCNEQPPAPIFKTPSPFWNQESVFRRPRHVREPTPDPLTLYPYRYPDLSCATGLNHIYSSLNVNSMNASNRYLTSKYLVNDPNIGRGTYYCSYLTSEVEDGLRNPHHPQTDPFLASYYYRGAVQDVLRRDVPSEEINTGSQKKRPREETYWYHGPEKKRILHGSKKRHYVKNNQLSGSLQYAESNKNNHHQPTLNPSMFEQSKDGENQTREELPLLDGREDAEKHQRNQSTHSESSSPVLCVLHRFVEGSLVELEGGRLKRVEDLRMEDLEQCAEQHPELKLERFTVLKITPSRTPAVLLHVEIERDHSQLSLEANEGLPFFVCGQGWSSCNPRHTRETCRLQCHQLKVGDVCLALTRDPAPVTQPANQSPAEVSTDHTEEKSTLPQKDKSRKRHFTAPELREIYKVHQDTD
ncbi:uncharacterized protein LOC130571630 [Triplophysa rosa]|uniref:AXH domain-containing protein n=1 Tax=Triplophysa rosa TaxID=992332 RepID=A0A9W7WF87_TRIRA|nr:uncharacterized protein LOC130571630 [Triplophysa rosa]KAI7795543.1 hypothetical protein IRJ41_021812 [Triplophysa rosa]